MAYNFKKLSEVDKVEEITDTTSVYVEVNGETKRVAKDKVGGASGVIVELGLVDNNAEVNAVEAYSVVPSYTLTGLDQNYDFIYDALLKGASVYLHLVPNTTSVNNATVAVAVQKPSYTPIEEYALVTAWTLDTINGLALKANFINYNDESVFIFPNGSHNNPSSGK